MAPRISPGLEPRPEPRPEPRIIGQAAVRRLLRMDGCIEAMAAALVALQEGKGENPLRTLLWAPDRKGLLGMMPASLATPPALGIKVVTVFPGNHGTELDSHQGVVLLFEPEAGRLLAVVDASEITAIRTAAVSGLATRLLARPGAGDLAILGSGVQATTHLEAMRTVLELDRVRVWSRSEANARAFSERESARHGVEIEVVASAENAIVGADVICTTTASAEPVLKGAWLEDGAHINAVGACMPSAREIDTEAMVRSRLFVDRRESALNEAGDFLIPKREGAIDDGHIVAELGEVLVESASGRRNPAEITIFKSLGLGVEDLAAAEWIYQRALEEDGDDEGSRTS